MGTSKRPKQIPQHRLPWGCLIAWQSACVPLFSCFQCHGRSIFQFQPYSQHKPYLNLLQTSKQKYFYFTGTDKHEKRASPVEIKPMGYIRKLAWFLKEVYCPANSMLYIIWCLQGMTCLFLSISGSPHHYSPCKKWHIKCKDQQSWKGNDPCYTQSQRATGS